MLGYGAPVFSPRRTSALVAALSLACGPVASEAAQAEGGTTVGSIGGTEGGDAGTSASEGGEGATAADECSSDSDCDSPTPLCEQAQCISCVDLSGTSCEDRSPATPVCLGSTGECLACTATDFGACAGTAQGCIDNTCAPCTEDSQCSTSSCLPDGTCLLDSVDVTGRVLRWDHADAPGVQVDSVSITNVDPAVVDTSIEADGSYSLSSALLIPNGNYDLDSALAQSDPVFVPEPLTHNRRRVRAENEHLSVDAPFVRYADLTRIAFECGIFSSQAEADGSDLGVVNTYFTSRSQVFGRIVNPAGGSPPTLGRQSISVDLGDAVYAWTNSHLSPADPYPEPSFLCFLDEAADGTIIGTTDDSSNSTGRWVMFRLRNYVNQTGRGFAQVNATGFESDAVDLAASGNIGFVELIGQ